MGMAAALFKAQEFAFHGRDIDNVFLTGKICFHHLGQAVAQNKWGHIVDELNFQHLRRFNFSQFQPPGVVKKYTRIGSSKMRPVAKVTVVTVEIKLPRLISLATCWLTV